jgi:hypothetical protein
MKTTTVVALSFALVSILAGCETRERVVVRAPPPRAVVVAAPPPPVVVVAPAPVVQERVIIH